MKLSNTKKEAQSSKSGHPEKVDNEDPNSTDGARHQAKYAACSSD